MGFTTGFTGGVTVTLGIAYLALQAHQRTRETQAEIIRAQTVLLDQTLPRPARRQFLATEQEQQEQQRQRLNGAAAPRRTPALSDTFKDRWNREIEGAARWMQRTDWAEVREGLEENAATGWNLLSRRLSGHETSLGQTAAAGEDAAKDKAGWLWAGAKAKGEEAGKVAEDKAVEAKGSLFSRTRVGVEVRNSLVGHQG